MLLRTVTYQQPPVSKINVVDGVHPPHDARDELHLILRLNFDQLRPLLFTVTLGFAGSQLRAVVEVVAGVVGACPVLTHIHWFWKLRNQAIIFLF